MKMDEGKIKEKLRKIVSSEMENAAGKSGGELSTARERLKRQYLGYGYSVDEDRAERNLSTYVDRTIMEVVEWAKPGLFRVFASTDEIIRYEPKTPQQEQAALDATLYVNNVIFGRNMFKLIQDVLTDGLMQRVGWAIAHCPTRETTRYSSYTGLAEEEAIAILSDPAFSDMDTDNLELDRTDTPYGSRYDLGIHQKVTTREIVVEPVPSEQVVYSGDATDLDNIRFIAHWDIKTYTELRKEGYKEEDLEDLEPLDEKDEMPEREVSRAINTEKSTEDARYSAKENRRYKIYEGWCEADINGDGLAEKVKVVFSGDGAQTRVLKYEEWPLYRHPLFAACSVPLPHTPVGICLADLVSDIQDLRTEVFRQFLDNLALSNQGELVVNEGDAGQVEYESLLSRGVGAIHRVRGGADIKPLQVATSSREALTGVETTEALIERRTGISARTQSLAADSLQNTATGASIMEESINQRLELIARVFAETFFRPLGRYVLHLAHKYQDKEVQVRLQGHYMAFDPRKWDPDMDIAVAVGLGTSNRSKLVKTFQNILQIQQAFLTQLGPSSPVRMRNIIYTCRKLVEASGLEDSERFFGTDQDADRAEMMMQKQAQQGSPKTKEAQEKIKIEGMKAQAKIQQEQMKLQAQNERDAFKVQADNQRKNIELGSKLQLRAQEMAMEKELDQTQMVMRNTVQAPPQPPMSPRPPMPPQAPVSPQAQDPALTNIKGPQ